MSRLLRRVNFYPIFKRGGEGFLLSLIFVVCKVMESMIRDEMMAHPEKFSRTDGKFAAHIRANQIRDNQLGSSPGKSCYDDQRGYPVPESCQDFHQGVIWEVHG